MSQFNHSKILLIVTGSISAYKSADLVSKLKQERFDVRVVLTINATRFISPLTFEALCGHPPLIDIWEPSRAMSHIELMRWADIILVAPASANYINSMSSGSGADLASTLFLAHDFKKPFLVAPAMNPSMLSHPKTQESLAALKKWGIKILLSPEGPMACGETGQGRLLEPLSLITCIKRELSLANPSPKLNLLITSGGTSVYIDAVRKITNFSTGKTGTQLCKKLYEMGHSVTFIQSQNGAKLEEALVPFLDTPDLKQLSYETPEELETHLFTELKINTNNNIIHLAAISDFDIKTPTLTSKISSDRTVELTLSPREKTINKIKELFPNSYLIGFKLTSGADEAQRILNVKKLFHNSNADTIIHNDLIDIQSGKPIYRIFNNKEQEIKSLDTINSLVIEIEKLLIQKSLTQGKE